MTPLETIPREVLATVDGRRQWIPEALFWRLKKAGEFVWAHDVRDVGVRKIRGPR